MSYEEDHVRAQVPDAAESEIQRCAEWMCKTLKENPTAMGFQFSYIRDEDIWRPNRDKKGNGRRRRRADEASSP